MASVAYDRTFFEKQSAGSVQSAEVLVPLILKHFPVRSVVDIGCGVGGWLREFKRRGTERTAGVDGDYVDRDQLLIDPENFYSRDLKKRIDGVPSAELAICLEVAEHLPPECADRLVADLCRLAPVVVFSAAVPGQGGRQHLNERWQSYWAGQFFGQGFAAEDLFRRAIWEDDRIKVWYRQNIMVYRRQDLVQVPEMLSTFDLDRVHPLFFESKIARKRNRWLRRRQREAHSLFDRAFAKIFGRGR